MSTRQGNAGDVEPQTTLKIQVIRGNAGIFGEPGAVEEVDVSADQVQQMDEESRETFLSSFPDAREWYEKTKAALEKRREEKGG